MRSSRGFFQAVAALAALFGALALPATIRAEDGVVPPVFVPGFWDLTAMPAKPDLRGLGSVRFVTTNDYPPFGFTGPGGALTGFNVDLARALCDELGVSCTIQQRPWADLVPALNAGQGDAAIASLAITDAARRDLDFTAPYYKTPARFLVRRPQRTGVVSPGTLAGKSVGVQAGTAHAAYLGLFFPKAIAKPYSTIEAARAALQAGAVDAVFGDGIAAALWLNGTDAGDCCAFAGGPYTESRFFGRGSGIAVRKGNIQLRQALDYALARVAARGLYGDLYLKYFPVGFY